jgi:hypothetical protein
MIKIVLNKPIRFLAFEWREHWEFDHPTVLLEPVFKFSPNGTSLEHMVEDAAIDIALAMEGCGEIPDHRMGSTRKEFRWRGWSLKTIKEKAEAKLRGRKVKFGTDYTGVLENWFVFKENASGEIEFEEISHG